MESIQFETTDGHRLAAEIAWPTGSPVGGVVVCHPHPAHGGNRFDHEVEALFTALPGAACE